MKCLLCTKSVRYGGFSEILFWRPIGRLYGYSLLMDDRLRFVWVLMCKEDFLWASKNPDSVQAIVNSKIGQVEK